MRVIARAATSSLERADVMLRDLKRAGLKLTPQRIAIVRLFSGDASHPTAQDLFERLRPSFPSMSFATVYNTLDALANAGMAGLVRLPGKRGDAARFDPNRQPHHHAVCDECGAVIDIAAGSLAPSPGATKKLRRAAPGFSVRAVERIYRGSCARCSRRSSQ
ncbi:MAG TPA: Fur family transcriptional regulator [Polyangiaceae bacterium]|nr:Fur family transcriptional regulator [Polyangiaceae bacterium]